MSNLIAVLFFVSFISLIIGLVYPNAFKRIFRKNEISRKFILKIFGTATAVLFVIIGFIAKPTQGPNNSAKQKIDNPSLISVENNNTQQDSNINNVPEQTNTEQVISDKLNNNQGGPQQEPQQEIGNQSNQEVVSKKVESSVSDLYSVTQVVDGDTIKINLNGTVVTLRLIGMDTPETVDPRKPVQCFGKEASNKAKELLSGKKVRIEKDSTQGDLDKYGRMLAYVYREDGLFYNKYMIEQGYAHEYTYNTPYKYQIDFKAAQKSAQDNQRGLWSSNTCNGDTTTAAVKTTTNTSATNNVASETKITGKYYTSSYKTSKYYYPVACSGWQNLDKSYLKAFDSLETLLAAYPSRILSPSCQ